ncbi:hypothetical protein BS78_09G179500 [Paspalum vaginatum]|nr:hypothetical protein BS78_09G179500 [Paspalum vaginatum]
MQWIQKRRLLLYEFTPKHILLFLEIEAADQYHVGSRLHPWRSSEVQNIYYLLRLLYPPERLRRSTKQRIPRSKRCILEGQRSGQLCMASDIFLKLIEQTI